MEEETTNNPENENVEAPIATPFVDNLQDAAIADLNEHRYFLFLNLVTAYMGWKCRLNDDFFAAGIQLDNGEWISYTLPMRLYDNCRLSEEETVPNYDGTTSEEVLARLNTNLVNL